MNITDEQGNKWYQHDIESDSDAKIFDTEKGPQRIIRTFVILTDPTKEEKPEDILAFHSSRVHQELYNDGWIAERELEIHEMEKGKYGIIAVAKPAVKHGSIIESTNQRPENANDLLNKK